jgi:hypothetical protein
MAGGEQAARLLDCSGEVAVVFSENSPIIETATVPTDGCQWVIV